MSSRTLTILHVQRYKELIKLNDIDSIDGNGQLYLALQDISMANFLDTLNTVWFIWLLSIWVKLYKYWILGSRNPSGSCLQAVFDNHNWRWMGFEEIETMFRNHVKGSQSKCECTCQKTRYHWFRKGRAFKGVLSKSYQ